MKSKRVYLNGLRDHKMMLYGIALFSCLFTFPASSYAITPNQAVSQNEKITVKGKVIDNNGEPILGASIIQKGTGNGTTSDLDGNFTLNVAAGTQLEVSYIGYTKQAVSAKRSLTIVLTEDHKVLDEVVVIGFGTVKKRDLTGSVTSIKNDVIQATPTKDVMQSLQGRVAGLDIAPNSNGELNLRIRGNRSINGSNNPLIIIDGMQGGSYADLNPSDIESVDVLKDASSTAIYGSQGANGVIIITTKKAQPGNVRVSYNGYIGIQSKKAHPDYRSGLNYYNARKTAAVNAGNWVSSADDLNLFGTQEALDAYNNNQWTNYEDLLMQNATFHNHQITLNGGTEKTTARLSLGLANNESNYKGGNTSRAILRGSIDHKVAKWMSAGVDFQLTYNQSKVSPYEDVSTQDVELGSPYDANGNIVTYPLGVTGYVNPLINSLAGYYAAQKSNSVDVLANAYMEIHPLKGLSIRSQLSTSLNYYGNGSYTDKNSESQIAGTKKSTAKDSKTNNRYIEWNNIVSYNKQFGDHNFTLTGITAYTKSIKDALTGTSYSQTAPNNLWWNLGAGIDPAVASSYIQTQTSSYAGRLNYSYKERYLLTASLRYDGSSVLAEGHKWASFPSVALAWRISDEPFMKATKSWLDDLKIRATYGVTGNSGIAAYGTQSGVVTTNTLLGFQDVSAQHTQFSNIIGNKETKWEKSKTFDVGFDFLAFNNRVNVVFDYYDTKTTDILLQRTLPTSNGNDGNFTIYQNLGSTSNKGFEFSVNTRNIVTKDFGWNSTLTFSANKERITDLIDGQDITLKNERESTTLMIGHPIKSYLTYTYQGIWKTSEKDLAATYFKDADKKSSFVPGEIKVADLDGDNYIDEKNDTHYIGSPTPKWFAGFNNDLRYKNFDFSVYMFVRWGQWGENPAANFDPSTGGKYTSYNYWEASTNEGGTLPMLYKDRKLYDYKGYQSLWYCDQSFFKIKTMTFGYTLPRKWLDVLKVNLVRFYVTASNPLYSAKSDWMDGYDPEGTSRSYVFGVNINL